MQLGRVLCNVGNDSVFSVVNLEVYISCIARVESSQLLLALLSSSKHTKSVGIVALVLAFSLGWFLFFFPPTFPFHYWDWIIGFGFMFLRGHVSFAHARWEIH